MLGDWPATSRRPGHRYGAFGAVGNSPRSDAAAHVGFGGLFSAIFQTFRPVVMKWQRTWTGRGEVEGPL